MNFLNISGPGVWSFLSIEAVPALENVEEIFIVLSRTLPERVHPDYEDCDFDEAVSRLIELLRTAGFLHPFYDKIAHTISTHNESFTA